MEPLPPFRIFLVDDEPFCLELYQQLLMQLGQQDLSCYTSSAACLDQLTRQPDIILLDYHMGDMDGIETLRKIKRFNPEILVLFISSQDQIDVAVNALKYGALDYIMKEQISEARLRNVLEKATALRELVSASRRKNLLGKMAKFIGLSLVVLSLFSCRTQNLFQTKGIQGRDSAAFALGEGYQYHIRTDDKISISIWDHDDLSVGSLYGIYNSNEVYGKWLQVNAEGTINVPRIGPLRVKGSTVLQTEDTLRGIFGRWLKDPVIDVKVLNKEVTLLGELKNPGRLLLEKDDSRLVELIGRAGDFDFYANKRHVRVIRMMADRPAVIDIDLTRMDNYAYSNVRILPGDVIYVPSKRGKDFEKRLSTILPLISMVTGFAIVYKAFF